MTKYSRDGFWIVNTQTIGIVFQCNITHDYNLSSFGHTLFRSLDVSLHKRVKQNNNNNQKLNKFFFIFTGWLFFCWLWSVLFVYRCVTDVIGAENQVILTTICVCVVGSSNGRNLLFNYSNTIIFKGSNHWILRVATSWRSALHSRIHINCKLYSMFWVKIDDLFIWNYVHLFWVTGIEINKSHEEKMLHQNKCNLINRYYILHVDKIDLN